MNFITSETPIKLPKNVVVSEDGTLLVSETLTEKIRAYGYDDRQYPNHFSLEKVLNTLSRWLDNQIEQGKRS